MAKPYFEEERRKARQLISDIWFDHGGLSPEDREKFRKNPSERSHLRQIQSLKQSVSAVTKRLVEDLYSKDTRFVYELIQNAEDNSYERAASQGHSPSLKFSLYPGKLVIDTNEDGFSEDDIKAICSASQTTKTKLLGYIGEKGIGFKSVFKVAKKVHIQSEPYSFSFSYSHGSEDAEDGIGMITPIQEEYYELPGNVQTRFTLTLIAQSDFDKRAEDLRSIPDSLLLFLTKLRKLKLQIQAPSGDVTEVIYSYRHDSEQGLDIIVKEELTNGELDSERESRFRVSKRVVTGLPFDKKRKGIDEATVVLAFPVDKIGHPVLESQQVYAYLPLRNFGFQFLIQSDFVTQADRENVFDSERNEAILEGVADTFRDAVLSFQEDSVMRYRWMRYLPPETIPDPFWKKLRKMIIDRLSHDPIVRSRKGNFCPPSQLSWVPNDFEDRDGIPLFSDLHTEVYMDRGYAKEDFKLLKPLGSTVLQWDDLVDRVAADLDRPDSRMKSPATDNDWHTRAADLLTKLFKTASDGPEPFEARMRVTNLPLVPLRGGKWAACSSTIYFPSTGQGVIPMDLGRNLVHPDATKNKSRAELFKVLGVKRCKVQQVLEWIRQKYESRPNSLTVEDSFLHLLYIFWNLPEDEKSLPFDIWVVSGDGVVLQPDEVYLPDSLDEYSAKNLFNPPEGTGSTQRYPAKFLHTKYLQAVSQNTRRHGRSWTDWLKEVVRIPSIPRLTCPTGLTEDFRYITKQRPDRLVGLLQKHWPHYKSLIVFVSNELRKCNVPTEGDCSTRLEFSYIPLPKLKSLVGAVPGCGRYFVRLPESIEDRDEVEWMFLKELGVQFSDDQNFYLNALGTLKGNKELSRGLVERCVFSIYSGIARNCRTDTEIVYARTYLERSKSIFVPGPGEMQYSWHQLSSCVWRGPTWLESTPALRTRSKYADVGQLFRTNLKLRNANWKDGIKELQEMRTKSTNDKRKTTEIYNYLSDAAAKEKECIEQMRARFEENRLVYVPLKEGWFPPSACIWADDSVQLPRKHSIGFDYEPLKYFFCSCLNVKEPSVSMLVDAVQEMSAFKPPPADQIKDTLIAISAMSPFALDLMSLHLIEFLPVRLLNGQIKLVKPSFDFSVVDRREYGEAFNGKAVLLTFSPTEVHLCKPVIHLLKLQDRLMSKAVMETTVITESVPAPRLTRNFSRRAYALFRCAVHFDSPKTRAKDRSLLKLLQSTTVHISHHISRSLCLVQGAAVCNASGLEANFHMNSTGSQLKLYVPGEREKVEACYLEELPKRLLEFFDLKDPAAEALIIRIMGSSSLDVVDRILEKEGIVEVNGVRRPAGDDEADSRHRVDSVHTQDLPGYVSRDRTVPVQDSAGPTAADVIDLTYSQPNGADPIIDILSARQRTISTHSPDPQIIDSIEQPVENTAYATLLERLIRTARKAYLPLSDTPSHCFCSRTSTLPTFNCADHHTTYPSIFNFRSLDRDRKVGAAGELFAFEILNHLNLPGFSATANWLSTLRKEARACAAYAALEPWHGAETSDIVYHDAAGALTAELREKGYFGADAVVERPTYYIEVKTTTRGCEEPLFMSGAQYARMQRMALTPGMRAAEVYVLVRVFNLEREDVGLRVYVDPERYKRAGALAFNADTWIVKPDNSHPPPEWSIVLD